jgi:hypothetical protein
MSLLSVNAWGARKKRGAASGGALQWQIGLAASDGGLVQAARTETTFEVGGAFRA